MKSYIEEELIGVQVEHIEKEINKTELLIRNQYDDTLRIVSFRCNYEIDLEDAKTQQEKLDIYKIWYEQILCTQIELQEEYKLPDDELHIDTNQQ